jgi:hypothetical protein
MVVPALAAGKAVGLSLKALKAFYASKNFLPALLGAGYLGSTAVGAIGQAGERGLSREQMKLQALMGKASAEVTERTVKESRARTKEYITALLKAKKEEAKETRELAAMQSFTESQNRQMALVLQAVQALSQRQMGASTQGPGVGMVGLMRGGF